MASVLIHAMGDLGEPCIWATGYVGGDMDVAALAGVSCNAARYESGSIPILLAGSDSAGWAWLALFAFICR